MSQSNEQKHHQECSDAASHCHTSSPPRNDDVISEPRYSPTSENTESTFVGGRPVDSEEIQTSDVSGMPNSSGGEQQEALLVRGQRDQKKDNVIESHDVTITTSSASLGDRRISDRCSLHPTEVVRMFCSDCETSFCVKCFFQTHKDHAVEDVDEASGKLRGKLNDYITRLSAQLASQPSNDVAGQRADNEIIDRIDKRVTKVRTVIDRCAEQLRQSLKRVLRQKELDIETKNSKELELRTECKSLMETCDALAVDGRAVDVLAEFKQVESRMLQWEKMMGSPSEADVNMNRDECLELVELDLEKYLPCDRRNLIGTVVQSHLELANFEQKKSYDELENELRREKDQNNELRKEIVTLGREHAAQSSQSDGEWKDKLAKTTHELNKQLETTKTRYEYDMAKLKEEHCIQLKQAQEAASTLFSANTSVSPSNEEIVRIAQDHASQLNHAEKKIAQLETTLAEYRKTIAELNAEHDRKLDRIQSEHQRELLRNKQEAEQKTDNDVDRRTDAKAIRTSKSENNDSSNDIDSVYERNRQVITSPIVKATVLKSPLLKSFSKRTSIDEEQEQEGKVVFRQSISTVKASSSPQVIKEYNNGTTDTQSKTICTDLSAQKTVSLKQQADKKKEEDTVEEQKSPVRRTRLSVTSQEASSHYSCNPSDIDAESVYSAYQDVLNDNSSTSWLILGYEDRKIVLLSTGSDYDTFKSSFTDDRGLYGFTRIISGDELSKRPKFVLIMWIGSNVGAPAAAKMTLGKSVVKAVIKHLAIEVQATTVEHLELGVLMESLKKAGGANYGTGI